MPHFQMRCNLAAAIFPFAAEFSGRTIIVPQYDQNYERTLVSSADTDKDRGIPQAYYLHNVMPTSQGFQSISFDQVIAAMAGAPTDFDNAFTMQDINANRFIWVPSTGKNYVYDGVVGAWASVSPVLPGVLPANVICTVAYINGETYTFYEGYGCFKYNATTKVFDVVTLTGLSTVDIKGITAANGYLIAWTKNSVAWSSTVDPTDFVPSLTTGAGGGSIQDIEGEIVVCLAISDGFIVYCERNAVGAKYTGNIQLPFFFKEVNGSGGLVSPEQVSWTSNLTEHYAWTTVGIQKIDKSNAILVTPEATDFLSSQIFEDFNETTLELTTEYLTSPLYTAVTIVADRYIVLSYGKNRPDFTHALVYDLALKRWGKLKITHRDVFQYNSPNLYGAITYGTLGNTGVTYGGFGLSTYGDLNSRISNSELPKKTLAFLQSDGTVVTVNFNASNAAANGVLMIGKFQLSRSRLITHQTTEVESVAKTVANFKLYLLVTLDGKTFEPIVEVTERPGRKPTALTRRFDKRISGINFSPLLIGAFNLNCMLEEMTMHGDR